jgi:hypothetical protein
MWALGNFVALPPSASLPKSKSDLYFFGWKFRNPVGFSTYRTELVKIFEPQPNETRQIARCLAPYDSRTRIGVYLKQKPFRHFENGEFLISLERVHALVTEYCTEKKLANENVVLILVADVPISKNAFPGFTTHQIAHTDRVNLFALASCSVVVGTNQFFPNLAAWFGNIPHIVETNEPVDWAYYRGKEHYFENRYATFAFGLPSIVPVK